MQLTIKTTQGDIVVRLYDETPLHRDNFVKLVREGFYNDTLFHRVIKDFMIQGGDPESKLAPKGKMLGTGGTGYTVPAEINVQQCFHKRGALCAARLGDEANPERESSGCQFYIVWGKVYKSGELKALEKQMAMQQEQTIFNSLVAQHRSEIMELRRNRDRVSLQALQDKLQEETKRLSKEQGVPHFTTEQTEAYTTVGGTPFLDGGYTVYGCVEQGLDVVEKIIGVKTDRNDRPIEDVKIIAIEEL